MGINLEQIFGNAKEAITQSADDAWKTVSHGALGYLENEAIKVLQADKAQNEKAFQTNVAEILKRPTATDSMGAYLSNMVQSPVLKEYGPYVIGAVVLCFAAALLLGRK